MKSIILTLAFSITFLAGCGRMTSEGDVQNDSGVDPKLVALADGTVMDVSCIRANAQAIIQNGRGAAESCVMGNAKNQTDSAGRGFGGYYPSWWNSYYYYPPSYYNGNSYNLCGYLGFYGNGYSTTYGYGYGYGYTYSNPYNSAYNCYSNFLGYDSGYTGYYNSSCDYCLNKANPSRCYNRCLYSGGWGGWAY